MASASSLPPLDLDPVSGAGLMPDLPKVSDSIKRFNQTPPELVDSLAGMLSVRARAAFSSNAASVPPNISSKWLSARPMC